MAKKLVIIEAPKKLSKFKQALGSGYEVLATYGHIIDLPAKKISVDIKNNFEPTFEITPDKKDVVKTLKNAAKKAEEIFLMTDEDREGEAIAWHVSNVIAKITKAKIRRATTNAITKSAINDAIAHTTDIDEGKIEAYLSRRILDRIAGYKTSFLTQQATGGRSAGRVQSALLRLIVEREQEILHFVPEEYWILTAHLLSSKKEIYDAVLTEKIKVPNEKKATEIYDAVIKGKPTITSVEYKEVNSKPYAPFTTLPLIASASTIHGWGAEKTMKVAQGLYEAGHVTYIRTDSPFMSPEAVDSIRHFVGHEYGNDYLPSNPLIYTAKKGAQEAHECCRPTDVNANLSLSGDDAKLYELVWKRAVSSQMMSGRDRRLKVITKIADYDFVSHGNVRLFDGYRKVWTYGSSSDVMLPELNEGEKCTLDSLNKDQKFTQPPSRYSDATLSKTAEKLQVTRPATFANSLATLKNRKYMERKKKSFHPTEIGIKVVDFLKAANVCFVDINFTSEMEILLDQVQDGKTTRSEVLKNFWTRLKGDIEKGKEVKDKQQVTNHKCPQCGGYLLKKNSVFGAFFACQNYKPPKTVKGEKVPQPDSCPYTAKVGEHDEPVEKKPVVKEYAKFKCKNCGSKMVKRASKHGEFYGCNSFPKCRTTADLEGIFKEPKNKKWKKKE